LNYVQITDKEIRLKFSETQTQVIPDYSTIDYEGDIMGIKKEDHTNVIVFSINRESGDATLFFDSPWTLHAHLNERGRVSNDAYFGHYESIFENVFGESDPVNLTPGVRRLFNEQPKRFRSQMVKDITSLNIKRTLSAEDLDVDQVCHTVACGVDRGSLERNGMLFLQDRSNGLLLGDTLVNIYPLDGKLSIPAQRLHSEVEYVISSVK
jgi:hypothetical protein